MIRTIWVYLLAAVLTLGVHILRRYFRRRVFRPTTGYPAATCDHVWRSVAAPYARQCRRCGESIFREDANGIFPDGLREYFDYIKQKEREDKKQ